MIFNFVMANLVPARLQALDDVLRPVFVGLRRLGHQVIAGARNFRPAPAINIVVEDFSGAEFMKSLNDARTAWSGRFRLGVLCADAPRAADMTPSRRAALRDVLPWVDFVWALAGTAPDGDFPADRIAVVEYGFDAALAGPRLISDAGLRDIGVAVYGADSQRRDGLVAALAAAGVPNLIVRPGALPDYLVTDLLSRAKLAALVGDGATPPAALAPRILKAICNGAAVVTESGGAFPDFATCCAFEEIPLCCRSLITEGRYAELGIGALERLRAAAAPGRGLAAAAALGALGPRAGS